MERYYPEKILSSRDIRRVGESSLPNGAAVEPGRLRGH